MIGPAKRAPLLLPLLALTCACAAGCLLSPDENLWRMRVGDGGVDRGVEAGTHDGPALEASGCSPLGLSAACDPLSPTSCAQGRCYVVLNKGSACVCPAGTIATGGTCFTSLECAPGHVCVAPQPGTCRATCARKDASTCPDGQSCRQINGLPQWGYCQ